MNNTIEFQRYNENDAIVFQTRASALFEEEAALEPVEIKKGYQGYIPWGDDNKMPANILDKIETNEVMSQNLYFNTMCGYGQGLEVKMKDESELPETVETFIDENDVSELLLENWLDLKHYYFALSEIILNNEGSEILEIYPLEVYYARFEKCDPKTGKIRNIFYANWDDDPNEEDVTAIPLLDPKRPHKDLKERLEAKTKDRKFAILTKTPTSGRKYYPRPTFYSAFESGWYDVSARIPIMKKMAMEYGLKVRFMVRIHDQYWQQIFADENITDDEKKRARKKQEYSNIKDFLTGYENQGKSWFSGYYVDPNTGKQNPYVEIEKIDNEMGGEYIQDVEEASNMICYAQGVHPSLIGATPGKTKGSFSGSDKRELFTMKQALEKPSRDKLLTQFQVIKKFNGWDKKVTFDIPDIMLTKLDEGNDAKKVSQQPQNLSNNDNNSD